MPAGRKDSSGNRPSIVCSSSKAQDKDPYPNRPNHNGKMSSSSDHLVPIAPRMPAMHDNRFAYLPVMRQPGQQAPMYSYHGVANHPMAMHAPGPYQAYYPRPMMMSSSSSTAEAVVNYNSPPGEPHPQMPPVGVPVAGYSYAVPPWPSPANSGNCKRTKSTRSSASEKDVNIEFDQSDDQMDSGSVKSIEKKRHRVHRSSSTSSAGKSSHDSLIIAEKEVDAVPSSSTATTSVNEKTMCKADEEDNSRYQPATPPGGVDEKEKVSFRATKRPSHHAFPPPRACVVDENSQEPRHSPDTDEGSGIAPLPDSARRFPPGACKKVYSPTGSVSTANDQETVIEPLPSFYPPAGLDMSEQLQHYKKTVQSLHERLKKEHEHRRQVSSQRIRAEMMWEAVAQELRQLRVHLARLATQPLPTAMASTMQLP